MRRLALAIAVALPLIVPTPTIAAGPISAPILDISTPVEQVKHRHWHKPRHCHRNVQRHRHGAYGRLWHRHVGSSCRIQPVRRNLHRHHHRGHDGRDCIRIGDVRICL